MDIVVFGSTDLTQIVLDFLHRQQYKIVAIVTVPRIFTISYKSDGVINSRFENLHIWGEEHSIPTFDYKNADQLIEDLNHLNIKADFAIVAGWYHMIPKKLRNIFSLGCSGFHASLLPKLRGGAPLSWAILSGLKETGVSFFELEDGVDDGLLYDREKFLIDEHDDIGNLVNKSYTAILTMLERILLKIKNKENVLFSQEGIPSYCGQRIPEDSLINWKDSASNILTLIKASAKPYSGAYTFLENQKIIIWKAQLSSLEILGAPGQILVVDGTAYIACGHESIIIKEAEGVELLLKSNHKRFI